MGKNILVGSVGVILLSGIIMGVNLDKENKELYKLVDEQSEVIKNNQIQMTNYEKAIDKLNQTIKDQVIIINDKDEKISQLKLDFDTKVEEEVEKIKKKQSPLTNVSRGEVINKRQLNMEVTAYTSSCNGCSGITYSGYDVRSTIRYQGLRVIAANFNKLPLYSIVRIDTNSDSFKAIVLDTGGAIRNSNTVDLLVNSYSDAIQFGRQKATVTILREGKS